MRTAIVSAVLVAVVSIIIGVAWNDPTGPNPFVVLGIFNGAIFGLVAIGLVLVYKGTRVFNFAHGELGTLAAYFLFIGIETINLPYGVGILFAILATVAVGLTIERIIIRPLIEAPRITVLVATIAVALLLIGLEILIFRIEPKSLSPIIPNVDAAGGFNGIELARLRIEPQRLVGAGVLLSLAGMIGYFFSRTDLGLAVLGTSQNAFATRVMGIGVERMSRFIWGSAALLAAIAGILYVPLVGALTPATMTSNILIPAFTGAVLGGMTSLPGAFVGGVVIGLVQSLSLWAAGHYHMPGGTEEVPAKLVGEVIPGAEWISIMTALLLVLLIRPQGLLGREA